MATRAQVTLRGRFSPGSQVRLVRVDDERALRAEGGEDVGSKKVDADGVVKFTSGVEVGARYFIVGQVDGSPLEVRARGRAAGDEAEVLEQAPVAPDRTRLADGSWADEAPAQEKTPSREVGPGPSQQQAGDVVQRSATPRGSAHPVDTDEQVPYRRQEDVPKGTVQMSDTPTGRATEIVQGPQSQEDVPAGTWQRSDTPVGVATPIPAGDAIEVQRVKESSAAKESRGEPVRAAAEPLKVAKGAPKAKRSAAPASTPAAPSDREDTSGRDAQGQPVADDVAAAAGVKPAGEPSAPTRSSSRRSSGKAKASGSGTRSSSASKSSSARSAKKKS